jgi:hypothetical protein
MANNTNVPAVAPFTVTLRRPDPKLIPVHQVEADASKEDLFHLQTSFADITDPTSTKTCLLFVPSGASATTNNIHIFFGPGGPNNDALTGALRFSANIANAILIVVPGIDPGFVTMSAAEVVEIMRKAGRPPQIDSLWLSAHSRGFRGLAQTLTKDLLVQRSGAVTAPKVGPGTVKRVVNFDAFYFDFLRAMNASGIPASKVFGFHVTIPGGGPGPGKWSASASQTVELAPVLNGVRAVLYSRLIQDAIAIGKKPLVPPGSLALADITGRLLTNMPAIPGFSSRTSPTDFRAYCKTNATAITNCLKDEQNRSLDTAMRGPLIEFVNDNNLTGVGRFPAAIWAHHLFVAEFAHEVTDSADPKP